MRMRMLSILFAALVGISLCAAGNSRAANEPASASAALGNASEDTISARMKFLDKNSPYLVEIFSGGEDSNFQGTGTGFVYKHEDGLFFILTNNHVVGPLSNSTVWVSFEGEEGLQKVEIIGRDPALDVALLGMPEMRPRGVFPATVNFSASLEIGDEVFALGYPLGKRQITFGWVNGLSAPARNWSFSSQAPLHPGNSGGPLVRFGKNGQPEVVGVNTEIISISLKSTSIHLRYVKKVLSRLLREKIVAHASAGLIFADSKKIHPAFFKDLLQMAYPPPEHGVMIFQVANGSPAEQAGLQKGDLLVKAVVKGHEMSFRNARELLELIFFDLRPGDALTLHVKRGAQILEKTIVLGEFAPPSQEEGAPEVPR